MQQSHQASFTRSHALLQSRTQTPRAVLQRHGETAVAGPIRTSTASQIHLCPPQFGGSRIEAVKRVRYTRDQLLGLRQALQILDVSKDILDLKQSIDVELCDAYGSLVHSDSNVQTQAYNRYDLKDDRDWRSRSAQTPNAVNEDKSRDNIHEAKESNASSGKEEQFYKHGKLSIHFDSEAQAMTDCGKLCIAPLNVHLPNTMSGEMMDSSTKAPEANLSVSSIIRSNQSSSDENCFGIVDKDVRKKSEQDIFRESSSEDPNSTKPKNYVNEESNLIVDFGENVSRSNSSASLSISRVGCTISEIMGLVVDAGAEEGRLGWLKRMCQLKK